MVRDSNGNIVKTFGVNQDITERKLAEEEREKLRKQLLQAQKMESVGRLAGGVAHDFNNMLGIIIGHAELALQQVAPSSPLHGNLNNIHGAAMKSADLTRQLLAFARKQIVLPEVFDLNDKVTGMIKMLQRLIGEDIELAWKPGTNLWRVKMDTAQTDQVLANLCVNARDAINGVGKITIETQNTILDEAACAGISSCEPGHYVLLRVSDTGGGMDADTLANIFEPFFTTKSLGEGTGLGLSTVYGIVKQNNGAIDVLSQPGLGTEFRIYLPRCLQKASAKKTSTAGDLTKGSGTVLIVEDEVSILEVAKAILERLGYTILTTNKPEKALTMVAQNPTPIDLLITDVVMPEMNGKDLAERIRKLNPDIKVLFMSGYTADVVALRGILEDNIQFLQKPFSMSTLSKKVNEVLAKSSA
jgi:nitrogen-specific signal transduction histidine kinase/CheY-like chemotaxis protein